MPNALKRSLPAIAAVVLTGCTAVTAPTAVAPTAPAPAPSTPASSPTASQTPTPSPAPPSPSPAGTTPSLKISGVTNFRDVAGENGGLALSDGGRMAAGVVYRSGRLKDASAADRKALAQAGLSEIYDLRTTRVARRSADPAIEGATYHLVNLFGVDATPSHDFDSAAEAKAQRRKMNRDFVADPEQRSRTASVLKAIAAADAPVLIHCTEGKDRTGWISAVLQLTAGADVDDVMAEYLLSNTYREDAVDRRYAEVRRTRGKQAADIDRLVYIVDQSYLQAGLDEIEERYGDFDTYLTEGLKLSAATIATLRDRLRGQ